MAGGPYAGVIRLPRCGSRFTGESGDDFLFHVKHRHSLADAELPKDQIQPIIHIDPTRDRADCAGRQPQIFRQ